MSPSWRERLDIVLCPQRVILLRFGRGLSRRVSDRAILDCEGAEGGPGWQPALDALRRALAEARWQKAEARVVLSNHFVHYLVIPWDEKLSAGEEQLAMVRYSFAQVYGEAAGGWDFRWDPGRPPAPCLACGIERGLLAGLDQALAEQGLRLASVQPYLMAAFNRWRGELDGEQDWFLLTEPGRLCLAWFRANAWAGVHSQQVDAGWGEALPQILDRARLLAGMTGAPPRLCIAAAEAAAELKLGEGWSGALLRPPPLPGLGPAAEAGYAMALHA